ncbi:unnamed protein product [Protopolystoma xenopodis]|uniref:Uncharacterized protein n=1 Tax=Protopolystoma xenopodis TaxID=117903 RepID=A0A448WHL2_9PLAT|nr:unnamed protein product [Protopolystoma xenopodis]
MHDVRTCVCVCKCSEKCDKPDAVTYGACNKVTCLQSVRLTKYREVQGNCVPFFSVANSVCCLPKNKVTKTCDKRTGQLVTRTVEYSLKSSLILKSLARKVSVDSKRPVCNPVVVSAEACNKLNPSTKRITSTINRLNTATCACIQVKQTHKEVPCTCPPPRVEGPKCFKDSNGREQFGIQTTNFSLIKEQCIPNRVFEVKPIKCAMQKITKSACRSCKRSVVKTYHEPKGCKCIKRQIVEKEACCCPKAVVKYRCKQDSNMEAEEIQNVLKEGKCVKTANL